MIASPHVTIPSSSRYARVVASASPALCGCSHGESMSTWTAGRPALPDGGWVRVRVSVRVRSRVRVGARVTAPLGSRARGEGEGVGVGVGEGWGEGTFRKQSSRKSPICAGVPSGGVGAASLQMAACSDMKVFFESYLGDGHG